MNVETAITKKGGDGVVSGCTAININRKKFFYKGSTRCCGDTDGKKNLKPW